MLTPYRKLFTPKGSVAFTLSGFLVRLAAAMYGVSTVVMVADVYGSYTLAGAVGGFSLAVAMVVVPRISRLIDRYGQARIAVPAAAIAGMGSAALLLAVH